MRRDNGLPRVAAPGITLCMGRAAGQRAEGPGSGGLAPALVVRGAAEAAAALRLAEGRAATLLSAPGAAGWLGAEAWRALVAEAAKQAPGARFADLLCCGDAPGHALAALRAGCRLLVLDGACPAFAQVAAAAAELGAVLLPARPPALDLAGLDLRKPGGALLLRRWLDQDDSAPATG
jgi:hypothetical protein